MRRATLLLLCCGVILLTAAGCGGSHRLSESDFRTRADRICRTLSRQTASNTSFSNAAFKQRISEIEAAVGDLARLDPPASDQARYQDLLTNFRSSATYLKVNRQRMILLLRHLTSNPTDARARAQYTRIVNHFEHGAHVAAADATALGLGDCATGLSGGSSSSTSG